MALNFTASSTTTAFWIPKLKGTLGHILLSLVLVSCSGQSEESKIDLKLTAQQTTSGGNVVLHLQAMDENNRPILGLEQEDIEVTVDGRTLKASPDLITPLADSNPPTAYIIVLVDFSGSMNRPATETDFRQPGDPAPSSDTKAQAALATLDTMIAQLADRQGETYLTILPFGEPGQPTETQPEGSCPAAQDYTVTAAKLDTFLAAGDELLKTTLDNRQAEAKDSNKVCASTNLYDPVHIALEFLEDTSNSQLYPSSDGTNGSQPRLSVVVLSDGYDNASSPTATDEDRFEDLKKSLESASDNQITIHTLGYGLTPIELQRKYGLDSRATRSDIYTVTESDKLAYEKLDYKNNPEEYLNFFRTRKKVPADEFVDQEKLKEIAGITGGIHEFAKNPKDVATSLESFFDAILGGYEIRYTQPGADRGSRHWAKVTIPTPDETMATSDATAYRMPFYGRDAEAPVQGWIFLGTLLGLGLGGVYPFWRWAEHLKKTE